MLSCSPQKESGTENRSAPDSSISAAEINDSSPERGDWLVQRLQAEPGTLNPIVATDYYESLVNSYIHETLITRDYRNPELWKPILAESWEESPDHLVYTFHLRRGIQWHNGAPFTAADVLYSYQVIMDPKTDCPHIRGYYQDVEKLEALDDYTIRFTFSKPFYLAFEMAGGITIVCKAAFDDGKDFNTHPMGRSPVGTGPYRFKEWKTGQEIVLERHPDYWGESIGLKSYVDRVVFRIAPDSIAALQQLRAGQLDMMTRIDAVQWVTQLAGQNVTSLFNKFEFYLPGYSYIGWNSLKPYFADKRVRLAMTHLVDREKFIEKVQFGLAKIVSGPMFFDSPYTNPNIKPWPYDPAKAKTLLEEAGWLDHDRDGIRDKDGVKFEFTFSIPAASKNGERIATLLKEELDKIGISMQIQKLEWALFIQRVQEKNFDAVTMAWSHPWSVDLYQIWHSSSAGPGGSNAVSFINAEADELIERLRRTFDKEERYQICHRFHEIVHEEQPYTFLYCPAELLAVDKRFQGVETFRIRPGYDTSEWWVPKALQKYQ